MNTKTYCPNYHSTPCDCEKVVTVQYFTADTHKITVTESYYYDGLIKPKYYHLEDGQELIIAEEQTVNVSDANGNGGRNPIRFVLKEQAQ